MLHVASVHFRSPRWIEIQTSHLRRHISVPFETWTSLERIDPAYGSHFDHVLDQQGSHAGKLNHLAMEIAQVAGEEDLIMFLDGDAFPIADPMPLIDEALGRAPLVAVRRAENVEEPQPHPCFCVTSVATWRALPGDWTAGPTWIGAHGRRTTDVGGNLMRRLELAKMPWVEVLRSNGHDVDPLYFAIYGDAIYHHGAGFRAGELSPVHRDMAPKPLPTLSLPVLRQARNLLNRERWRRWERNMKRHHVEQSESFYAKIAGGSDAWLDELR